MLPAISLLRRHRLSSKLTLRFLVQRGENRFFPRQARQRRDRTAHPFPPSRRQQPGTVRINPKRPITPLLNLNLSTRLRLCPPNPNPCQVMRRRRRFPRRVLKTSSQWKTRKRVNELRARVESPSRTKLPAIFKRSRILRCPHPNRLQRSCCVLKTLPILSKVPLKPLPPPSRNLCVLQHHPVHHLVHHPTRMSLPKIALHTTILHSSHFLRPQSIGSPHH